MLSYSISESIVFFAPGRLGGSKIITRYTIKRYVLRQGEGRFVFVSKLCVHSPVVGGYFHLFTLSKYNFHVLLLEAG